MRKSIESNIQPSMAARSARRWLGVSERNHGSLPAKGASMGKRGATATHEATGRAHETQTAQWRECGNFLLDRQLPMEVRRCSL